MIHTVLHYKPCAYIGDCACIIIFEALLECAYNRDWASTRDCAFNRDNTVCEDVVYDLLWIVNACQCNVSPPTLLIASRGQAHGCTQKLVPPLRGDEGCEPLAVFSSWYFAVAMRGIQGSEVFDPAVNVRKSILQRFEWVASPIHVTIKSNQCRCTGHRWISVLKQEGGTNQSAHLRVALSRLAVPWCPAQP